MTGSGYDPDNPSRWFAKGAWVEVVTPKGKLFLPYHFNGEVPGTDHAFDLRGVRPVGIEKMNKSSFEWAKDLVRRLFGA